jgi:hypothetical protein
MTADEGVVVGCEDYLLFRLCFIYRFNWKENE